MGTADTDNNSQDDPYDVAMPGVPTAILTGDFGYTPAGGFGSIGNKVWHDLDGDGFRDPGEPGIQGVTIELWLDVDGDGVLTPGVDNLVRNATTDDSGEYEFNSLPLGDYLVNVTDVGGVLDDFVKTTGTSTVDDNSQANPYPVTLDSGNPDNVTADFGYWADPINSVLTIAGTVFEDVDNDAVFDDGSEPEIENATVFLFRDLDGNGVLDPTDSFFGSLQTDANGDYLFTNLPPGDYLLTVDVDGTPVDDFLQTTQSATGGVQPVSLPTTFPPDPGAPNSTGNDFGFWNGGTVTNPITLAWFRAEEAGSGVRFEWMTATETGNVGFNLYAVGEQGMRRLNDALIPSRVIDSLEPQRYELEAWDAVEQTFVLEDIDLRGVRRYHGPFQRGETRGAEPQQRAHPLGRDPLGTGRAPGRCRRRQRGVWSVGGPVRRFARGRGARAGRRLAGRAAGGARGRHLPGDLRTAAGGGDRPDRRAGGGAGAARGRPAGADPGRERQPLRPRQLHRVPRRGAGDALYPDQRLHACGCRRKQARRIERQDRPAAALGRGAGLLHRAAGGQPGPEVHPDGAGGRSLVRGAPAGLRRPGERRVRGRGGRLRGRLGGARSRALGLERVPAGPGPPRGDRVERLELWRGVVRRPGGASGRDRALLGRAGRGHQPARASPCRTTAARRGTWWRWIGCG